MPSFEIWSFSHPSNPDSLMDEKIVLDTHRYDLDQFRTCLTMRWPDIESEETSRSLTWQQIDDRGNLIGRGRLNKSGYQITINTPYKAFMLWLRHVTPFTVRLMLVDVGSGTFMELLPTTPYDDISRIVGSGYDPYTW